VFDLLAQAQERRYRQTLLSTLRHLGAAGLFALAVIDSSPIPTFAGPDILTAILAASHKPLWYEYAASATAGSVLGAYITFRIAAEPEPHTWIANLRKAKLSKFLKLFRKWGTGTLAASTAIPCLLQPACSSLQPGSLITHVEDLLPSLLCRAESATSGLPSSQRTIEFDH